MLSTLALHKSWIVFVGTFFLGESVVLVSAALAATGTWSVWAVVGWAFAGTVISDTAWFRTARLGLGRWTSDSGRAARLALTTRRLDRLSGAHPHRALLFVKFVYGTRIASIAYMALRQVPAGRFVVFDSIGTAVWLAVMVPLGWAIGMGAESLGADLKRFEWAILGIVLVGAAAKGYMAWRHQSRA